MILLKFFFFLTRALKTPWWTGLVLCALFRACSDYSFHTIPWVSGRFQAKKERPLRPLLGEVLFEVPLELVARIPQALSLIHI